MPDKIGDIGDRIFDLKAEKARHEEAVRGINAELETLQFRLANMMEEQGIDKFNSEKGCLTRKIELYPQVKDKDTFVDWAVNTGNTAMLQLQANRAVFRQYFEENHEYPEGLDAYEKVSINTRKGR